MLDSGDTAAFLKLPPRLQSEVSIHRDFRAAYRRAIAAGLITPNTATRNEGLENL